MMSSHPNNRKSIIYRSIVKDDLEQIEQLHEVLFPIRYQKSFYQQLLNPTTITVLAVISQQFYRSDQQGGQQIVGVSTLREVHETLGRRCWTLLNGLSTKKAYLMTFGIAPPWRQQGLGTQLWQETVKVLCQRKFTEVWLHVKKDNIVAIRFYKKCGWIIVSELKNYYFIDDQYHDAYLMKYIIKATKQKGLDARHENDNTEADVEQRFIASRQDRIVTIFLLLLMIALLIVMILLGIYSFQYYQHNQQRPLLLSQENAKLY